MYDPVRFQKEKSQRAFNWIRVKGFLSLLQEAKARNRAHYFEIFAQWDGHHSLTVPLLRTRFCLWAGETDTRCYNQLVQNPAFLCWKFSKSMVHGSQQSRGSEPELESPAGHAPPSTSASAGRAGACALRVDWDTPGCTGQGHLRGRHQAPAPPVPPETQTWCRFCCLDLRP